MNEAAKQLPPVFVDRSLGRIAVPELLRKGGIELVTLAEHYGVPEDETVEDVTWIADASQRNWILFMKDDRIRRRPAERAMIHAHAARCFCLSNANLRAAQMAERHLSNLSAIVRATEQFGPYLYSVQASRIERLSIG